MPNLHIEGAMSLWWMWKGLLLVAVLLGLILLLHKRYPNTVDQHGEVDEEEE
jgi:hypothetical protein